jgi:hypothetical protein
MLWSGEWKAMELYLESDGQIADEMLSTEQLIENRESHSRNADEKGSAIAALWHLSLCLSRVTSVGEVDYYTGKKGRSYGALFRPHGWIPHCCMKHAIVRRRDAITLISKRGPRKRTTLDWAYLKFIHK